MAAGSCRHWSLAAGLMAALSQLADFDTQIAVIRCRVAVPLGSRSPEQWRRHVDVTVRPATAAEVDACLRPVIA
jgi:hypothetical protein